MPRPPPQGGPPQVMHNDPRAPRPDWNRPPGNSIIFSYINFDFTLELEKCQKFLSFVFFLFQFFDISQY